MPTAAVAACVIFDLFGAFEDAPEDQIGCAERYLSWTGRDSVAISSKAIEVLRRQADGSWKLIAGNPHGRE